MDPDPANLDEGRALVAFRIAHTPFEARVIVAVLLGAGIPAFVPDGALADEFAASQRLMNLQNVRVLVPADRLDEAEEALAAARSSAAELERSDRPPEGD